MPGPPSKGQVVDEDRLHEVDKALNECSLQLTDNTQEDKGSVQDDDSVPDESGGVPAESESQRVPASMRKTQAYAPGDGSTPFATPRTDDPDELRIELAAAVDQYLPVRSIPTTATKQQMFYSPKSRTEDEAIVVPTSLSPPSRAVLTGDAPQTDVNAIVEAAVRESILHDVDIISDREDQMPPGKDIRIETHQFEDTSAEWGHLLNGDAGEYNEDLSEMSRENSSYLNTSADLPGLRVAGEMPQVRSDASYFKVQDIEVHEPPEQDGSLGLLLSGNTVVAFTCPEAQASGWQLGDVIVKVNGRSCEHFNQFVHILGEARDEGFPICFSVLRCVTAHDQRDTDTECNLDDVINLTNMVERAEQMQHNRPNCMYGAVVGDERTVLKPSDWRLQGPMDWRLQGLHTSDSSVFENPYVDALRKRRVTLGEKHAEGWNTCGESSAEDHSFNSLASRLATEREGVASLTSKPDPKQRKIGGESWYPEICLRPELVEPAPAASHFAAGREFADFVRKGNMERPAVAFGKQDNRCGALVLCNGEELGEKSTVIGEKGLPRLKMSRLSQSRNASEAKGMEICCKDELASASTPSVHRPLSAPMEPCNSPDDEPDEAAKNSAPRKEESGCLASVMEVCADSEVSGASEFTGVSDHGDEGQLAESAHENIAESACENEPPSEKSAKACPELLSKPLLKGQRRPKANSARPRLETVEEHPCGNYNEDDEDEDENELVALRKSLASRSSPGFVSMTSNEDQSSRNFAMKLVQSWGPAG